MRNHTAFPEVSLESVADINPETLSENTSRDYSFRYIDLSAVKEGIIDWKATNRLTFSAAPSRARRKLRQGDCLFGTVRPLQQSHGFIDRSATDLVASTGFAVIRTRPGMADPRFIYYWMLSTAALRQADNLAVGSNYPAVNESDMRRLRLALPPYDEQRCIGEILDAIDDSIDAVNRIIRKLQLEHTGLMHHILSGIDTPPRPLIDFLSAKPRNGFSPKEIEPWTGVVVLGLGCLTKEGFTPKQLKNIPPKDSRYKDSWLSDGDLLLSRSNTFDLVGMVGRYKDVGMPCVYPDLMMKLTPNSLVRPDLLELTLRGADARRQIQSIAQGTSGSMVKISASSVAKIQVRVPDLPEQDRILLACSLDVSQIESQGRERDKLRLLKQGLLGDLLTGRVRVTGRGLERAGVG